MSTEQTKNEIDIWIDEEESHRRATALHDLAEEAGIGNLFRHLPPTRIRNMDPDKYWMNVLAMAKIRELRRIAEK